MHIRDSAADMSFAHCFCNKLTRYACLPRGSTAVLLLCATSVRIAEHIVADLVRSARVGVAKLSSIRATKCACSTRRYKVRFLILAPSLLSDLRQSM